MTLYNVHLYRETRLHFPGITADTPEQAARIAADRPTADAEFIEDCDGDNLAALIDVAGDDEFTQSVTIDFEPERLRRMVPELLEALDYLLRETVDMDLKYGIGLSEGEKAARAMALAAIAKATDALPERRSA